eukprot:jgi/Galph1/862/GphlegSOOS_G5665.1
MSVLKCGDLWKCFHTTSHISRAVFRCQQKENIIRPVYEYALQRCFCSSTERKSPSEKLRKGLFELICGTSTLGFLSRFLPQTVKSSFKELKRNPYIRLSRLDKPIGTWLLYLPCTWSIALAGSPGQLPDVFLLTTFGIGALLLRGAGCTVNDLWDSKLDRLVERSKTRPLASGELSKQQGFAFLTAQLLGGLPILLSLNTYSQLLGASSLSLVLLYPLAKRVTFWPQLVLGFTFNWGALLGWAAVKGSLELPAFCLYSSGILWTLIYDTIYAHQDKTDDLKVGIRSTAIYFGKNTRRWLSGFAIAHSGLLVSTGLLTGQSWPFYAAITLGGVHLLKQIFKTDYDKPTECLRTFCSNRNYGLVIFLGISLGNLFR